MSMVVVPQHAVAAGLRLVAARAAAVILPTASPLLPDAAGKEEVQSFLSDDRTITQFDLILWL